MLHIGSSSAALHDSPHSACPLSYVPSRASGSSRIQCRCPPQLPAVQSLSACSAACCIKDNKDIWPPLSCRSWMCPCRKAAGLAQRQQHPAACGGSSNGWRLMMTVHWSQRRQKQWLAALWACEAWIPRLSSWQRRAPAAAWSMRPHCSAVLQQHPHQCGWRSSPKLLPCPPSCCRHPTQAQLQQIQQPPNQAAPSSCSFLSHRCCRPPVPCVAAPWWLEHPPRRSATCSSLCPFLQHPPAMRPGALCRKAASRSAWPR